MNVEQTIRAEMVASVHSVVVAVGDPVDVGDTLVILESMKMEMPVESPVDGRVKEIRVKEGQAVAEGDVLAVVE